MWVCRILHSLSNPAFSILIRCAGGDSQHNLSAAVRWGTRQGASVKMRPSCARTVAQGLGMGRMEKASLSNPAFSILTRCAGGDPQRNLSAAVGWGTRGSQPGGIGQIGLGMSTAHVPRSKQCVGLQDFAFPFKPCLFHPDPMRWWRFPTQLVRRCRVGHPPRGIGQMRPSCARTVAQGLGMGHMEKAFPVEPCLFHPDPMRWWRSPTQLVRRCRVGHPRVAAGGGSVKCVELRAHGGAGSWHGTHGKSISCRTLPFPS